jgi:hypothetical protein
MRVAQVVKLAEQLAALQRASDRARVAAASVQLQRQAASGPWAASLLDGGGGQDSSALQVAAAQQARHVVGRQIAH